MDVQLVLVVVGLLVQCRGGVEEAGGAFEGIEGRDCEENWIGGMMMAEKLAPNFVDDEFRCKHCGKLPEKGMKTLLIVLLQLLRNKVGKPLVIMSGYRCKTHNKNVGGATNSQHLYGTAADVVIPGGWTGESLAKAAEEVGFDGIGIYKTFIHVDVRGTKARWRG